MPTSDCLNMESQSMMAHGWYTQNQRKTGGGDTTFMCIFFHFSPQSPPPPPPGATQGWVRHRGDPSLGPTLQAVTPFRGGLRGPACTSVAPACNDCVA